MQRLAWLSLLAIGACASNRAMFQPAGDDITSAGHGGQPAAAYDVREQPDVDPRIHVNVWSRGARQLDDRTLVGMSMEVQNTSDQPITVATEEMQLIAFDNYGRQFSPPALVSVRADHPSGAVVPAGTASTMQLTFQMPKLDPSQIGSLRLRWGLAQGNGERYLQFTEFTRVRMPETTYVAYDPVFGYYDPFWYGYGYGYHHFRYHVPVRRTIIVDRDRVNRPRVERRAPATNR
ncbi:MAG: hypothetical protein AB7O24_26670 [Kofleriaceae bacterium]